jgi:serine/threonine protein kinase
VRSSVLRSQHDPDAPTKGEAEAEGERQATPPASAPREDLTGQTIADRYQLEGLVGMGLTSCVYRARRLSDGAPVAVKVLQERLRADPNVVRRFAREAEAAHKLAHPNIARILDHGTDAAGRPYVCTEWLTGMPLDQALRHGPVTLRRAVAPLCDVLSALSAAHRDGIVHGCLKPSNVLLTLGPDGNLTPKLLDFGMGRLLKPVPSTGKTKYGAACVVAEYVAPEQIETVEFDGRADVYVVGVLLYELLTGDPPFRGGSFESCLKRHREETLTQVHSKERPNRKIPREIESICLRALAKKPADRFQSPLEMARALRAALDLLGARIDLALEAPDSALDRLHTVSKDRLTMPGEQLRSRHKLLVGAALLLFVCSVVWLSAPHPTKEQATETLPARAHPGQRALEQGRQLLADGDLAAAVPLLNSAREQLGETAAVLRWLGEALVRSGQREQGEPLLQRYLAQHPQAPDRAQVEALLRSAP